MIRKKKEQKNKLLEYLVKETGCQDLSDLRSGFWFPVACFIAGSVRADEYSLKEWNETVRYLTGVRIRFFSPQKAQKFLEENKDNFYMETEAKKL